MDDDELLTLHGTDQHRWYSRLDVGGTIYIRFLLDCGATANLIPESTVRAMGRLKKIVQRQRTYVC